MCIHKGFLEDCSEFKEKIGGVHDIQVARTRTDAMLPDVFIKTEHSEGFEGNEVEISDSFLVDCIELKRKVGDIFVSSVIGSHTGIDIADSFVKIEGLDKEFEMDKMEIPVKPEFIEVKSEEDEEER